LITIFLKANTLGWRVGHPLVLWLKWPGNRREVIPDLSFSGVDLSTSGQSGIISKAPRITLKVLVLAA
jgi:hypothetical protein